MSNVKPTDTFMVAREGTEFKVKEKDFSNLRDTDLFWVQRSGVDYSVTADQVNAGGKAEAPVLNSVQLTQTTTGDRFTDQSFITSPLFTTPGNPIPTVGLKGEVTGALSIAGASDEIVEITPGINYSETCTFYNTQSNPYDPGSEVNTFDGDLTTSWVLYGDPIQQSTFGTITFHPPVPVNSEVQIYTQGSWNIGDTFSQQYSYNGEPNVVVGSTDDSNAVGSVWRWVTVSTGSSQMTTLKIGRVKTGSGGWGVNYAPAIKVDGKILMDASGSTLTLASDASLETFKAGDAVKQSNSPLVPTSSAIVNVGTVTDWNQSQVWSNGVTAPSSPQVDYPLTLAFNGDLVTGYNCCFPDPGSYVQVDFTGFSDAKEVSVYYAAIGSGLQLEVNGVGLPITTVVPGPGKVTLNVTGTGLNNLYWNEVDSSNYIGVYGVEVDGVLLADAGVPGSPTATLLSLTNSDGLSDFAVGDVVQGNPNWNQSQEWSSYFTSAPSYAGSETRAFNGTEADPQAGYWNNECTWRPATPIVYTDKVEIKDGVSDQGWRLNETGNYTPIASSDYVVAASGGGILTAVQTNRPSSQAQVHAFMSLRIDGKVYVDASVPDPLTVSITAIDEAAPSITVDGGSWSGTDGSGDPAWNQAQNWSANVSGPVTAGYEGAGAFDGDTSSAGWLAAVNSTSTWTVSYPVTSSVRLYLFSENADQSDAGSVDITVDGNTEAITNVGGTVGRWVTAFTGSGTLTKIENKLQSNINKYVAVTAIEIDGVLLVNTGITGGPETFVTGPSKDITATYVSADPSVPSMTVSDVVGPWSANTGNYVVNTVVNPVLIKPETSAITSVVDGASYSATSDMENPANAFDGDTTTTVSGCKGGSFYNTITTTPFTASEIEIKCNAVSGVTDIKVNGGNGYTPIKDGDDPGWFRVPLNQGEETITSVTMAWNQGSSSGIAFNVYGVKADGVLLVDSVPTLTLTDDTDLNQFATGDNVYAAGDAPATFAPVLYTGNDDTQSFGLGFTPGLVWHKCRTRSDSHALFDIVRGDEKRLLANTTNDQYDIPNSTTFDPKGFTIGSNNVANRGGEDYVAWCFNAGDTTDTNNDGTIESQVRSNGAFSIVSYTGNATVGATVGHGLNSQPKMVIFKRYDVGGSTSNWIVQHIGIGLGSGRLFLNTTEANSTSGSTSYWNNTAPDSSVVTLGTNAEVNSGNIIAYMWAESPAQNFGKYSGGNTGTAITCGFEPAFVLIKNATGTADWAIYDNARSTVNPRNNILSPNESIAETGDNSIYDIDFTSTGFTVNATSSVININGDEYIYMAIASAGGASGVVGDITGLDMTLSESSGTWEVGQTVTTDEKPALASTVALNFDANGAVSGIAAGNPSYVNMNSNNPILNFPSTFADGQTPDATIPEGSYIQTEVRAWNAEGESIKKSNKITPTSSVTLSKGETKLIDGYTPVATAHAREVIAEANQIEDQIQRATDNLNIAMANYEEQGKRRSV